MRRNDHAQMDITYDRSKTPMHHSGAATMAVLSNLDRPDSHNGLGCPSTTQWSLSFVRILRSDHPS